jgi:hypothetical protein
MGAKTVYCVSIVYNFYAGCTKVAPGMKKEKATCIPVHEGDGIRE